MQSIRKSQISRADFGERLKVDAVYRRLLRTAAAGSRCWIDGPMNLWVARGLDSAGDENLLSASDRSVVALTDSSRFTERLSPMFTTTVYTLKRDI